MKWSRTHNQLQSHTEMMTTRAHSALVCMLMLAVCCIASASAAAPFNCYGEYELCPTSNDCVLIHEWCGRCQSTEYLCPDGITCITEVELYTSECPGLNGTHLDWTLPLERRIDLFLSNLTLSEKIAQLQNEAPSIPHVALPTMNWLNDDVHSVMQPHATVFPDGNGLGATWSRQALFDTGYTIGNEARATHNNLVHQGNRGLNDNGAGMTTYAPNINLVRDPRWGRNQEVYSEDPYLTSRLTVSYVQGQQGINETETPYLMAGSCCKHFVAYDVESNPVDRMRFNAVVSTRNFWESYLPAFEACVVEAQATSVMCSYNSMRGVPTCGDENLLNGILRRRWNFTGFVVSDYDAWSNLVDTHHVCPDYECAAAMGINAGMDQEGGGNAAIGGMAAAVAAGTVATETIDTALRRLMRVRIRLGMLDPPTMSPWNQLDNSTVESSAHLGIALDVARQSICLYKNNQTVLPLSPSAVSSGQIKLALIGPQHIDADLILGNYDKEPLYPGVVSILQGILSEVSAPIPCTTQKDYDYLVPGELGIKVWSAEQCATICSTVPSCRFYTYYEQECYLKNSASGGQYSPGRISGSCKTQENILFATGCTDENCADNALFPQAFETAAQATHIILTLGLDQSMESEGHDRSDINLPYFQYLLLSGLKERLTPSQRIVCVLIHGGSFALKNLLTDCDAIVDGWFPGSEGGTAIANVLFGSYNPGGRTAVTWYRETSELPDMGEMSFYPIGNASTGVYDSLGYTYRYFIGVPDLPFGYGLSYTQFSYSNLELSSPAVGGCERIYVNVTVTNVGPIAGDDVVQLYLTQPYASVPAPQVRLAGFERVSLASGASTVVSFTVDPAYHAVIIDEQFDNFWQPTRRVEQGSIQLYVAHDSGRGEGTLNANVQITSTVDLDSCKQ